MADHSFEITGTCGQIFVLFRKIVCTSWNNFPFFLNWEIEDATESEYTVSDILSEGIDMKGYSREMKIKKNKKCMKKGAVLSLV